MRARAQIKSHPIHPVLVAFPIGLWITGWIMDVVGVIGNQPMLTSAAWYCILAGCIGAALAAAAGTIDLFSVVPPRSSGRSRGYKHAMLNVAALVLFIAVLALQGSEMPSAFTLFVGAVGVAVVGVSGWLGGTLVYRNQIAVDHRYANAGKWRERQLDSWNDPVCKEHELAYGQMMLVQVGGQRIAIGRCNDGLVAFSDHCTHRGGPLSDGVLAGCTVQCPWHGSQFNVHTGRVVNGPAEEGIEAYDAFVQNGQVYVRPRRLEQKVA